MKYAAIILSIILGIAILCGVIVLTTYNGVVGLEEQILSSQSNIQTQQMRRFDLYQNTVDAIVEFANHEKLQIDVSKARAGLSDGDTSQATVLVNAVTENYPEIKADSMFLNYTKMLESTENQIAQYRENYNIQVRNYNKKIRSFPAKWIMGWFGYEEIEETYLRFEGYVEAPTGLFNK